MPIHRELPWNLHPDLEKERLEQLARLAVRVRSEALALHAPESGETGWSLGCRCFERFKHLVREEAKQLEWLDVIEDAPHFVFIIGAVPVRHYHGEEEEPPRARWLSRGFAERVCEQFAFEGRECDADDPWFWRMITSLDEASHAERVTFVQMREDGSRRHPWTAFVADNDTSTQAALLEVDPDAPKLTGSASVLPAARRGVELPPPQVRSKIAARRQVKDDDGEAG